MIVTRPPWKRTCGKLNQRLRIASASSALNATMKPSMTSRACFTAVSIASEVIQVIVPLIAGKFEALFNHRVLAHRKTDVGQWSRRCPLCPQKRTLELSRGMSALCQQRTRAVQQTICVNGYPKGAEGACLFRRGASMMLRLSVEGSQHAIADNRNTAARRSGTCHLRQCANLATSVDDYADSDRRRQVADRNRCASPFQSGGG